MINKNLPEVEWACNQYYITEVVCALIGGFRYVGYFRVWSYDNHIEFYGICVDEFTSGCTTVETFDEDVVDCWLPFPRPIGDCEND